MSKHKSEKLKNVQCKNCKTKFKGNFCPNCGQSTNEFDKPIKFLIVDLVGNVFAFDTRFWTSLKALATSPGKYTLEYLEGKRARYMPPFRLNIFISFLFFLLLSNNLNHNIKVSEEDKESIQFAFDKKNTKDNDNSLDINIVGVEDDEEEDVLATAMAILNNPDIYINSFLKYLSWSMFLLMPVFAFYQWLFFRKSRPNYYGHLVSSINQHSLIFLLFILLLLMKIIIPDRDSFPEDYLMWFLPIYVMISNKHLYQRRWLSTFFRSLSVLILYFFTLLFAVGGVLVLWTVNQFV